MKKLFSGRVGRIPAMVLALALIAVVAAGGIVAATSGYVLWEGSSNITVTEPITIYYGPDTGSCNTEIGLNDPMGAEVGLEPGECRDTYFKFVSVSSGDLLIKAIVATSDATAVDVTFTSANITTTGLIINNTLPVYVLRSVCVNGSAPEGVYAVSTTFTRESPAP